MDERDRHAALSHTAGHPLDRIMADVSGTKDSRQGGLKLKWGARFGLGRDISARVDEAVGVTLQLLGHPCVGLRRRRS